MMTEPFAMMKAVKAALRTLAGNCDGAVRRDDAGFNKLDANFGRKLAALSVEWNGSIPYKLFPYVCKVLHRYRGQISAAGISIDLKKLVAIRGADSTKLPKIGVAVDPRAHFVESASYPGLCQECGRSFADGDKIAYLPGYESPDNKGKTWCFTCANKCRVVSLDENGDFKVQVMSDRDRDVSWIIRESGATHNDNGTYTLKADGLRAAKAIQKMVRRTGINVTPDAVEKVNVFVSAARAAAALSEAEYDSMELPENLVDLHPFQVAAVRYAMARKRLIFGDEMGLGKTVEALATLHMMNAFPAIVICPATIKRKWARECKRWIPGRKVEVVRNNKYRPTDDVDVIIVNYERLSRSAYVETEAKKELNLTFARTFAPKQRKPFVPPPLVTELMRSGAKALIVDESHRMKSESANCTKAILMLATTDVRLLLTGTPIPNRPTELITQLKAIGRFEPLFGRVTNFENTFTRYVWDSMGRRKPEFCNLDKLNDTLRADCFVRRLKKDVLTELPDKTRSVIPTALDGRYMAEYRRLELDAMVWFGEKAVRDRAFLQAIAGMNEEDRKAAITRRHNDAVYRASKAEALTRISALKQKAALGKVDMVAEWVKDFMESEHSLVIVCWHHEVIAGLAAKLAELQPKTLTGETPMNERDAVIADFQSGKTRVLIMNMLVGGLGIDLFASSNIAFVELGWNPGQHDQAEDRLHRMGQKNAVSCWYFIADGTIDEDVHKVIEDKREMIAKAIDGEGSSGIDWISVVEKRMGRLSRKL